MPASITLKPFMAWVIGGANEAVWVCQLIKTVSFTQSVRGKFVAASLVLLLIPLVGFMFVRELIGYLRSGQEQVAVTAARLVAASLSDRPEIDLRALVEAGPVDPIDAVVRERERIVAFFSAGDPVMLASLGDLYQPDKQVEKILNQTGVRDGRVWVVDGRGLVRGLAGSLSAKSNKWTSPATTDKVADGVNTSRWLSAPPIQALLNPITRTLMPMLLPSPSATVTDANTKPLVLAQAQRAAIGASTVAWHLLPDRVAVLSVAAPIWQQDNIVAAVVIEETDAPYRNLAKGAAESVVVLTLVLFLVVFVFLFGFAFRLATRLTKLQREANRAIDSQGRVRGEIHASKDRDEIGALNETLRTMVARQAGYNSYLEQLAARLSHELRTPVAVVRSSLDNLRVSTMSPQDAVFLARADEGVARLATLISRMSEATQLERILQGASREPIDLVGLVAGCVAGYQQTFVSSRFIFTSDVDRIAVEAATDAMAQMLDKLVQNAIDFAEPASPVVVRICRASELSVGITVENSGPLLPDSGAELALLFDSMVSKRVGKSEQSHLGLGLYIARLIAEFHHGAISAENLADRSGVRFTVTLPVAVQLAAS